MTDWIEQEDWSTPKVGDQVRATHDENVLTGKVEDVFSRARTSIVGREVYALELKTDILTRSQTVFASEWSLSVPAKPADEIPTEPGVYYGSQFGADVPFFLGADGGWRTSAKQVHVPERHMPLLKLEPVAVTAKKVLDWIEDRASNHNEFYDVAIDKAHKEFGVTDD